MREKVKALVWEECRVGGVIAAVSLLCETVVLLVYGLEFGPTAARRDPVAFSLVVLAAPILVALLLVFTPDHSGSLIGGYSRRVLRLPVPTWIAVAISLCARALFVFLVAVVTVSISRGLFENSLGFHAVLLVTALYLGTQLLDWLRAPISGLSSMVFLALIGAVAVLLISDSIGLDDGASALLKQAPLSLAASLTAIAGLLLITYCAAVPAVHAARVGRSVGIPEVWDWPKRLSLGGYGRRRPFSSPVAAQVWFELRRSAWIFPSLTLLGCLIGAIALWIHLRSAGDGQDMVARGLYSFVPFLALIFGAAAQGTRTSIAGFRRPTGTPGYAYLQPLTNSQFALARTISNGISLLPTLIFVLAAHFSIAGGSFLLDVIPQALDQEVTSMREVVWTLLSRGFLVGFMAWALLAVSTRLIIGAIAATPLILILTEFTADALLDAQIGLSMLPIAVFLIGLTATAYAHAWRTKLISPRAFAAWACAWALTTWLVYGVSRVSIQLQATAAIWHLMAFFVCVGLATLVPLPYIAVLLDVRRRRHSASPTQDSSQYDRLSPMFATNRARRLAAGTTAIAVLAVLWLGWPGRPRYEEAWRSRGYPATLSELDDWYVAVPPEENRALKYMEIAKLQRQKAIEFRKVLEESPRERDPMSSGWMYEDVLIVGGAEVELGEPLPEDVRVATEDYWEHVTSHVAPALRALSADRPGKSRYPIDLNEGFQIKLDDLARLRILARELGVDAFHWSLAGQSGQAAESVIAILPIANSLAEEPLLISQLVRIAILGIALADLEEVLNRTTFEANDLAQLQAVFAEALPPPQENLMLDRAMVGESILALTVFGRTHSAFAYDGHAATLSTPMRQLASPAAAERMVMALFYEDCRKASRLPGPELQEWTYWDTRFQETFFIAPLFSILAPAVGRAYEAEWRIRTQIDLAITALAIEQYRLAQGRLPEGLANLVPAYLDAVPEDYFAGAGKLIRYRQREGGNYTVYSLGRDMEDDGGERMKKWWSEGDITFSVVSRKDE